MLGTICYGFYHLQMHCRRRAVLWLRTNAISFLLYWRGNKNTLLLCLIQSNLIGRNGNFNRIETSVFIKCTAVFRLHIMANRSIFSWLRYPVLLYSSLSVIKLESPLHFNFQKKCTETFMLCTHPIHNIKWSRLAMGQDTSASITQWTAANAKMANLHYIWTRT